jgi:hypothetical protein
VWGSNDTKKAPHLPNCAPGGKSKHRLRLRNGPNLAQEVLLLLPPSEKGYGEDPVVRNGDEVLALRLANAAAVLAQLQMLSCRSICICGVMPSLQGLLLPKLGSEVR